MLFRRIIRSFVSTRAFASSAKSTGNGKSKDGSPKKSTKSSSPPPSSQPITPKTQTTASSQPPSHSTPVANKAAGSDYLVPEYFQHNQDTYADLFVDMARHRLPPPVRPGRH